ncbi:MAG: preprotein translocase subunit SecA [Planctomycetes bacterium]|nr:preprotein translocase subunit SecA [Planctomycetota bacterium]
MNTIAATIRRWTPWRGERPEPWSIHHSAVTAMAERATPLRSLSDQQLRAAAGGLRERLKSEDERTLAAQIEAGSLMFEAIRRTTGMELFETQRLAGFVLTAGMIAEMRTGEGKTLSGAFPIFYGALLGEGVHVMTANAYLAARDAEILRPILNLLGVSVGLLEPRDNDKQRQHNYQCDATFGAGYEFGFDFLRDQLALRASGPQYLGAELELLLRGKEPKAPLLRQRGLARAVIDEVDSILLDEGTVPLLLSGKDERTKHDPTVFQLAQEVAEQLAPSDYEADRATISARLTEKGYWTVASALCRLGRVKFARPWQDYVVKALVANHCLDRDVHYVVIDKKVVIVDDFTGRLQSDRSWKDGLHQAVETKEQLELSPNNRTLAHTSRQRFLRQYGLLSGMTGTAAGSEAELRDTYDLDVVTIPTHRPSKRKYLPDRFFADNGAKWKAAVAEIAKLHEQGRPVLVGSRTIQTSKAVAKLLAEHGIPCQTLNGVQTADEASLVARAGEMKAVMVATNMAGRGTDIRLSPGVSELGGLHVIGLERHASPRIDNQLAGRVARQGDPGSSQFMISADDPLIQEFAPELGAEMISRARADGEVPIDLTIQVRQAQQVAEEQACLRRNQLREHDQWLGETVKHLFGVG